MGKTKTSLRDAKEPTYSNNELSNPADNLKNTINENFKSNVSLVSFAIENNHVDAINNRNRCWLQKSRDSFESKFIEHTFMYAVTLLYFFNSLFCLLCNVLELLVWTGLLLENSSCKNCRKYFYCLHLTLKVYQPDKLYKLIICNT